MVLRCIEVKGLR